MTKLISVDDSDPQVPKDQATKFGCIVVDPETAQVSHVLSESKRVQS